MTEMVAMTWDPADEANELYRLLGVECSFAKTRAIKRAWRDGWEMGMGNAADMATASTEEMAELRRAITKRIEET